MNWASGDFMPKRGRAESSQAGQQSQSTERGVSREREWLPSWGELGKSMGIHFLNILFPFFLHSASIPSPFSTSTS